MIQPTTCASSHSSPNSKADFDQTKQDKYKAAVATAAGTTAANVDIITITEARRRAGSIKVETKVSWQRSKAVSQRRLCNILAWH